jgi:addiction module RelE/StbE family toxin
MPRIRWLRLALADLDGIAEYIARDDPETARQVVEKIRDRALALRDQPALGRPGRVPGTRELVLVGRPFILPYRVERGEVQILRVLHTARKRGGQAEGGQ